MERQLALCLCMCNDSLQSHNGSQVCRWQSNDIPDAHADAWAVCVDNDGGDFGISVAQNAAVPVVKGIRLLFLDYYSFSIPHRETKQICVWHNISGQSWEGGDIKYLKCALIRTVWCWHLAEQDIHPSWLLSGFRYDKGTHQRHSTSLLLWHSEPPDLKKIIK